MATEGEVMEALVFRSMDSPVGLLTLAGKDGRLMHLRMVDQTYEPSHDGWEPDDDAFPDAVEQLEAYFAGDRTDFELELDMVGTQFQRRVWNPTWLKLVHTAGADFDERFAEIVR